MRSFDRGRAMSICHHSIDVDAEFLEQTQQFLPSRIITDNSHHADRHAQVDQHLGHAGRPAKSRPRRCT